MPLDDFFLGLDLGQAHDYTALAILERAFETGPWDPVVFAYPKYAVLRLRLLDRLPLGTPYPDMVDRVASIARYPDLDGSRYLAVDATGVGRPVVDLLRRAPMSVRLLPAIITTGAAATFHKGYHVPKNDLITGLQVHLQKGELQIASGLLLGPTLVREMSDMRVKVTLAGTEQYGAWREGQHDDLVFAVALACWAARLIYPHPTVGGVGYWQRSPDLGGGF